MLAAVLHEPGRIRVEEVPTPGCGEDEVLLKVMAVGLCGSDIRTIISGHRRVKYPQILGHEIVGIVEQVGRRVSGFQPGQRWFISPSVPCNRCPACLRGWLNQCEDLVVPGMTFPGGFAEYFVIPREVLERGQQIPIPDHLSYGEAVMAEPLSSVYASQECAGVSLGDIVVVIGAGPIGCLHLELAKLRGAERVIMIEQSPQRLQMAARYGADHLINAAETDVVAAVKELTGGWGADVIISANPSVEAQQQAVMMAAKRGRVVLFGGVPHGKKAELDTNIIHYNQLALLGHYSYDHVQNYGAFQLIASGKLQAKKYITHELPLTGIEKGIELARSGEAMKVILTPHSGGC